MLNAAKNYSLDEKIQITWKWRANCVDFGSRRISFVAILTFTNCRNLFCLNWINSIKYLQPVYLKTFNPHVKIDKSEHWFFFKLHSSNLVCCITIARDKYMLNTRAPSNFIVFVKFSRFARLHKRLMNLKCFLMLEIFQNACRYH